MCTVRPDMLMPAIIHMPFTCIRCVPSLITLNRNIFICARRQTFYEKKLCRDASSVIWQCILSFNKTTLLFHIFNLCYGIASLCNCYADGIAEFR